MGGQSSLEWHRWRRHHLHERRNQVRVQRLSKRPLRSRLSDRQPPGRVHCTERQDLLRRSRPKYSAIGAGLLRRFNPQLLQHGVHRLSSMQPRARATRGWINVNGPFRYNGNLYVASQDGRLACATTAMTACPTPIMNLPAFGDARMPGLQDSSFWVTNGEQIGSKLYLTQNTSGGVFFQCVDLSNNTSCFTPVYNNNLSNGGDDNLTFFSYDTAGNETAVCVLNIQSGNNGCVSLSGTNLGAIAGMSSGLSDLQNGWGGDTISWEGKRTLLCRRQLGSSRVLELGRWRCRMPWWGLFGDRFGLHRKLRRQPVRLRSSLRQLHCRSRTPRDLLLLQPRRVHRVRRRQTQHHHPPLHLRRRHQQLGRSSASLRTHGPKLIRCGPRFPPQDGGSAVNGELDRVELHNNGGIIDLSTVRPVAERALPDPGGQCETRPHHRRPRLDRTNQPPTSPSSSNQPSPARSVATP